MDIGEIDMTLEQREAFDRYREAVLEAAEWDAIAPTGLTKRQREKEKRLNDAVEQAETALIRALAASQPAPFVKSPTNDQIAAAMLLHGTPAQQAEAVAYVSQPAPLDAERITDEMVEAAYEEGNSRRWSGSLKDFRAVLEAALRQKDGKA